MVASANKDVSALIPKLGLWNNGTGIDPDAWIYLEGRADQALGFCSFMWPEFVEFEDYVLRAPLDADRLRGWERVEGITRQQIETAMNAYLLDRVFPQDETVEPLKGKQCRRLAEFMAEMLDAKLAREFPRKKFSTFVLSDSDFGVSFHQL